MSSQFDEVLPTDWHMRDDRTLQLFATPSEVKEDGLLISATAITVFQNS
jgi:hypothetical protein